MKPRRRAISVVFTIWHTLMMRTHTRLQLDVLRQNNLPDGVPPIATSK
jgi:hypothetical protein